MFWLIQFVTGFCRIRIEGAGKERFLNLCRHKKMLIWDLRTQEDSYYLCVSYKAYFLLEEISKKTNTKVYVLGKYGLPFFLYRNRRRKAFGICMLLSVITLYLCSLFVWNIQINGTLRYTEDEIRTYLEENHISSGIWKSKIDCPSIEEAIRRDFEEAAWVSCDLEGTRLTISLKESNTVTEEKEKEQTPGHIVAKKDGEIHSIVTRAGTPVLKKGEKVKAGDILISGIVTLYNDYGEAVEERYVCADGDVVGKTSYKYEEQFPLNSYKKVYTGQEIKDYRICIGEVCLPGIKKKEEFEYFDKVTEQKHLKIGEHFYLPVSLQISIYKEYTLEPVRLTEEEAKEKANRQIERYVENLKEEEKQLLENQISVNISDGICKMAGTVIVLESIGKIRNIP